VTRSREEQETIVRFDRASPLATLWTAAAPIAGKWTRLGYPVQVERYGWRCEVPIRALTFRRLGQKPQDGEKQPVPPQFLKTKAGGRAEG